MSNQEYMNILLELFKELDESDNKFLKQLLTLVRHHLKRKGGH